MPYYQSDDGLRLHYTDEGEGTPVIALPGLTRNGADFDHLAPHIDVRLIRPDYRGRGRSGWADHATYTVPQEAKDILRLMDHLGLDSAAFIGTSRGGLVSMMLAATAKQRLMGVVLNDIGPELDDAGLDVIMDYIGRNPAQKTYADAAAAREKASPQFLGVPMDRWLTEAKNHYDLTDDGLVIRYDPKLRDAMLANAEAPKPDLWPLFEALDGIPLALIRGVNSDLLTKTSAKKMAANRPDMIWAEVPDRGHVPFLDEPEALTAIQTWLGQIA